MNVSIKDVEKMFKTVLGDSDILNVESVYEKIEGEEDKLKLIIFLNKIFGDHDSILYTKFIFVTDASKINVVNENFLYLYDINCVYNNVEFDDLDDLKKKVKRIITKHKFGANIKILSEFIENPAFLINTWLKKNKINEFSVSNIKYNPKIYIIPCKSLFFAFIITANNIEIGLKITKEKSDIFFYAFDINNETINVEKQNLNTLVETIGEVLKNNLR